MRIRPGGVSTPAACAGSLGAATDVDSDICSRSFGSRTRKTSVSLTRPSLVLNEYCALLNGDAAGYSRRILTHRDVDGLPSSICAPAPAMIELGSMLDRPRATSKSGANCCFNGT